MRGILFLFLALGLSLGSQVHAYWGPPTEDAVQFYQHMLRMGKVSYDANNSHRGMQYWASLTRDWENVQVKSFLKESLENVGGFGNCRYCDLTLAAYLSNDESLKTRAISLAKKRFQGFNGTEQEKQNHYREVMNSHLHQLISHQDKLELPYEKIGSYWGELNVPFKWTVEFLEQYLIFPHHQPQHVSIAMAILKASLGGEEEFARWWDGERDRRVQEFVSKLEIYLATAPEVDREDRRQEWHEVRDKWHQVRFLLLQVAERLPGELLVRAYERISLNPWHDNFHSELLYILTKTKDKEAHRQASQLIEKRIKGKDTSYVEYINKYLKSEDGNFRHRHDEWMHEMEHDEEDESNYYKYPRNNFYQERQKRNRDLLTEEGRRNSYVDEILNVYMRFISNRQSREEGNPDIGDMVSLYGLRYEDFQLYIEHFLSKPTGRLVGLGKILAMHFKGEQYVAEIEARREQGRKEKAMEFLAAIPVAKVHEAFSPVQAYYYNIYVHSGDREIQELILSKWHQLQADEQLRHFWRWNILIAGKSGNPELIQRVVEQLNAELAGQGDEDSRHRWGNPETPVDERFSRFMDETSHFFLYELRLGDDLDDVVPVLVQLKAVKDTKVQENLWERANRDGRHPETKIARALLRAMVGEARFNEKIPESVQGPGPDRRRNWYQNIEGNLGSIERVYHDEQRDGSNHRSGRQLPNQFQMVFAEVFAPPVKAFIAEKLELLTLAREFSLTGNMWYLALTSGHDSLKKQAIQLFRQRLLGEDEEFNRVWGVAAENLHQRFQILMEPLFYALTEDHWAPDAEGALVGLVLSVEVDYSLVGPYLEQIYSVSSESHLKKIAGRLIGELKGLEYLESLPDLSLRKKFLIVNGGYSELSNYSVNEEDVKSFHYNLFHGQSVVLNAGGPGGTVVPISGGQSLRDEAGLIKLEPGLVLETPYRAATNANLKKAIGEIRESNPIAVTAVYGDHGGPQSLALWNGDYLTATALQKMYREFPEETPIRSIFLQCYAGTLIVSPERKRPPFVAGLKSFINHHYPLNRCAYANSHHDELGTYYSWGSKWENSNWSQLFKARPNLSLRILKDFMGQEGQVHSTPILSSDYFIYDFIQTFCLEVSSYEDLAQKHGVNVDAWSPAIKKRAQFMTVPKLPREKINLARQVLCESSLEEERQKVVREYERSFDLHYNKVRSLDNQWRREIIQDKYPEVYKKMLEGNRLRSEIMTKYANEGTDLELMSEEDRQKIRDIQANYIFPYQHLEKSFDYMKEFDPILNQKAIDYFKANKETFGEFVHENILKVDHHRRIIDEVKSNLQNRMRSKQSERKRVESKIYRQRQEGLEPLLDEPELEFIKVRYENLLQCESAIIN